MTPRNTRIAEVSEMPVKFDAQEFDAALRQFKPAKTDPAAPVASPSAARNASGDWQEQQNQELKLRVISSRAKLKLMRDRSEALRDSLQRFRSQHQSVSNG
jgi:hypothetical protein